MVFDGNVLQWPVCTQSINVEKVSSNEVLWFWTNEEVVYVRPDQATFNLGCSGLKVGRIVKVIFRHVTTHTSSQLKSAGNLG